MNFLKFLFLGNFFLIAFSAIILTRYYILSSKLFKLSGLLFFKFLLRLIIFNTFLYFIYNLSFISLNGGPIEKIKQIVVISSDFKMNTINDSQIKKIINIMNKNDLDKYYYLSVFDPLTDSLGTLIPQSNYMVFHNFINHVDFKKSHPIYKIKFSPINRLSAQMNESKIFIKNRNELIDLENSSDNYLYLKENWFSINQLSIYLLILLLFLLLIDASFKFQILK
jgi:hypothetical protein